jgi:pyrimidine-nucleoside phosphorylase
MYDIILNKRNGGTLSEAEIEYFVTGVTDGSIPPEQITALLMSIYFKGMTTAETVTLTMAMARSGEMVDLSPIEGIKVDKHSTGGVGDKTTMVVAPIVAACGVKVAKMSGKGLGHTGGTVDKLSAIPGFKTELPLDEFIGTVNKHGLCVIGQSGEFAPADKKLYALRDVTATVDSLPLIAASIMSKKLAAGADCILLDVKTGSGAFMKTTEGAAELARAMVDIGNGAGRKTAAVITGMDRPLGSAIGNSLEVIEAAETLKGHGPEDLTEVCLTLAARLMYMAGKGTLTECRAAAEAAINSGAAFNKLHDMVEAQGGGCGALRDYSLLPKATYKHEVLAPRTGYIRFMDTERWGIASVKLGAGRAAKDDAIDYGAGIYLHKKTGAYVNAGEVVATLYANNEGLFGDACETALEGLVIGDEKPEDEPLIYAVLE